MDLNRCKIVPYQHQRVGIEALVKFEDHAIGRVLPGCFALFDEMGAGKTLQTIVSALLLFVDNQVDAVIVIAPASVRTVWFDPELGELKKHLWDDVPVTVTELHTKTRTWRAGPTNTQRRFTWVITNYEWIRSGPHLEDALAWAGERTLLVLDESSAIKSHRAEQTKACLKLRRKCGRVLLLNGTPIANNPLDMYAQGLMMDPRILDVKNFFHFRARYAIMGGWQQRQVIQWQNLEDLQRRFAPYVLRRLKKDCLDLPPKLPPTSVTVTLTKQTWTHYKQMRDQLVTWLSETEVATAAQAGVKAMRLAQVCAGFLGGVQGTEELFDDEPESQIADVEREIRDDKPSFIPAGRAGLERLTDIDLRRNTTKQVSSDVPGDAFDSHQIADIGRKMDGLEGIPITREIGREKLVAFLDWLDTRLFEDPDLKLLVWCRFRPEVKRIFEEISHCKSYRNVSLGLIWGGQKKEERAAALRLLDPRTAPTGPAVVIGTPASGSMGLNLAAANQVIYVSNDFNLKVRLQSEDRVHRPGQTRPVSYTDVIAVGPQGQKTIDYLIIKALREKEDLANWTTQAWINALQQE